MSEKRKKLWWPPWAYETRPWAALALGFLLAIAALLLSIGAGQWGLTTFILIGTGFILCIYGAITLQLRREYREASKWSRTHPSSDKGRDR